MLGSMDSIILDGIALYAYGGVTAGERELGQRYRVDVELSLDLAAAGRSDDVRDTVDYGAVTQAVVSSVRSAPFNLIEHAATRVAEAVLDGFAVDSVTVRLAKLLPPVDGVVASAAVQVTRRRADVSGDR